ncbi:MAG: alpha-L-fucosidase [Phycisphaerae bacterium]|nr:alpha-L-fucosidase [Phycisphaerae bacterium]
MAELRKTVGESSWFVRDRFGMFIHWGLYSMAARHEWVMHNEKIDPSEYEKKYFSRFDPDLYNPQAWADAAGRAGMKYFVITTKHHEGFCLWDSKLTTYKATRTPAKRDLLRPMVEAFRKRNLRVGLYHSLIDWHHDQYVIDSHFGPLRDHPDREKLNRKRDQAKYAEYLHGQVRELLSNYGKIDVLWFDFSYPKPDGSGKGHQDWQSEKLYKLVRKLQPKVLLNDRIDLPDSWDIKTPEQVVPRQGVVVDGQPVVWEACHTFSGSWGYHRDEASWKSVPQLVEMLIDTVSKNGNLLLNVGPTSRGTFDERTMDRLNGIGQWMDSHGKSIYGCGAAPEEFPVPQDCRLTWNPAQKRMYVHLLAWPFRHLHLDGFKNRVEYAQLLNDGSEIRFHQDGHQGLNFKGLAAPETLTLELPVQRPHVTVPVIELFMK